MKTNYDILNVSDTITEDVVHSFGDLPIDNYLKGYEYKFRRRRFSRARMNGDKIEWQEDSSFEQSSAYNSFMGDKLRQFEPLSEHAKGFSLKVFRLALEKLGGPFSQLGAHQIRVTTEDGYLACPAPEGVHRDGFKFIAILPVSLCNVNGAESILFNDRKMEVFSKTLQAGELLLLDDEKMYHYVTPFTPRIPGEALRDIFVFTVA